MISIVDIVAILVVRDVLSAGSPRAVWKPIVVFTIEDVQAEAKPPLMQINEKSGS